MLSAIKKNKKIMNTLKDIQISCNDAISFLDDILAYDQLGTGEVRLRRKCLDTWSFLQTALSPFSIMVN